MRGSMARARIEWVDIAKGIGIILVIFGHSLALAGAGERAGRVSRERWRTPAVIRQLPRHIAQGFAALYAPFGVFAI